MLRDTVLSSNVQTSIYSNGGQGCAALSDREIEVVLLSSVNRVPAERASQLFPGPHSFHARMKNSGEGA
jgi:hypothetical protein